MAYGALRGLFGLIWHGLEWVYTVMGALFR